MGVFSTQPKQCAGFPAHRLIDPPTSPLTTDGDAVLGEGGGTTSARAVLTGRAASRPMCQPAWRSGRSETANEIPRCGVAAADVPPSSATGAADEPQRALQRPGLGRGG